ncbi:MAG: hypothetical protein Tsb0010_13280 [Parvularculaceae bacterium]
MRHFMIAAAVIALLPIIGFGGLYAVSEAKLRDIALNREFDHAIPDEADSIARGRHIATTRGCLGCHGPDLAGRDFTEEWGEIIARPIAPNLASYVREHGAAIVERAVRQGVSARGKALVAMPSYNFARLSDEDMADLIAFLRSSPVVENDLPETKLGWRMRALLATGSEKHVNAWVQATPELKLDPATDAQRARGEYLAMTICIECHGLDLRGFTLFPPATPDLATVAAYSRDAFERLIRTGVAIGGRELDLMGLVATERFAELSEEEVDSLYSYLFVLGDEPAPEGVFWRP